MKLSLLLCNVLFIPIVIGTTNPDKVGSDKSLSTKETSGVGLKNNISITPIIAEGGSVLASTPMTLLQQNHSLLSLDKEMDVGKSVQSTGSNVKARKGVTLPSNTTVAPLPVSVEIKLLDDNKNNTQTKNKTDTQNKLTHPSVVPQTEKKNKTVVTTPKPVDKVDNPKKPLKLSNEDLDKMAVTEDIYIPTSRLVSTGSKLKQADTSRLVMPVVITILVVPMFAVLGCMALRHGREAWKNRHYKRMDFLLDGMYNE